MREDDGDIVPPLRDVLSRISLEHATQKGLDAPTAEQGFAEYKASLLLHNGRVYAAAVAVITAAWWLGDPFTMAVLPDGVRAVAWFRGLTIVNHTALLASLLLLPGPRAVATALVVSQGLNAALLGYTMGILGPPSTPWFHLTHLAALIPLLAPIGAWPRACVTVLGMSTIHAAYLVGCPGASADPLYPASIGTHLFAMVVGLVLGQIVHGLHETNFTTRRSLKQLASELEGRVEERTAELARLADHVSRLRDDEQARIARELHDDIGQEVAAVGYVVAMAAQRTDVPAVRRTLEDVQQLLSRIGEAIQSLTTELRPRILADVGLFAAVGWLCRRTEARSGMSVTLETEGHDETVAPEVATAAFRIVQEALSNTLRHAEGSCVAVSLQAGEKLVVRVTDDGVGLSARRGERRGMGLVNIRERAAGLGGRADVRDAAPVGTTVEAELPLAPVRKAGS